METLAYIIKYLSPSITYPTSVHIGRVFTRVAFDIGYGDDFLSEMKKGNIIFSSGMPVSQRDKMVFKFPTPLDIITKSIRWIRKVKRFDRKLWKKNRYLEMEEIIKIKAELESSNLDGIREIIGKLIADKEPNENTVGDYASRSRAVGITHNKLSRKNLKSENIFVNKVSVKSGTTLWFAIRTKDKSIDMIQDISKVIELVGIGGRRSIGMGKIKLKIIPEDNDVYNFISKNVRSGLLLSKAVITEDIRGVFSSETMNIITRGGKAIGPIPVITEGSVVKNDVSGVNISLDKEIIPGKPFFIKYGGDD